MREPGGPRGRVPDPYATVLLDLDGTLTDPERGIVNSIRYALQRLGLDDPGDAVLRNFIGPPLRASFMDVFGLDEAGGERAIGLYREYFADRGLYENQVYPGVEALLQELTGRGVRLALATAKPHVYANPILEHFDLSRYFEFVAGSELDGRRTAKDEVIAHALAGLGVEASPRVVMVGDRVHDIQGAHRRGVPAVGVTWGFGSLEELQGAQPTHIVSSVPDLGRVLRGERV